MKKHVPNMLTISRLFLLPFIWYYISRKSFTGTVLACVFIAILGLTDILDGFLARRFHAESHLGRILDPVVDKTGGSLILIAMVVFRELPLWYAMVVIIRNLLMIAGGAYMIFYRNQLVESNILGKFTFTTTVFVMGVYLLNIQMLQTASILFSLIMLLLSTVNYFLTNIKNIEHVKSMTGNRKYRFNLESYIKSLLG